MGIFERRPVAAEHKPRPVNVGELFDHYLAGRHTAVRDAFAGLTPADAAGLAASIIEHAGQHVMSRSTSARALRVVLELCEYFRRWQS